MAAMALGEGIVAARVVEGSFTKQTFMEYLCDDVVHFPNYSCPLYLNKHMYEVTNDYTLPWSSKRPNYGQCSYSSFPGD